jgi:hypothetical protein
MRGKVVWFTENVMEKPEFKLVMGQVEKITKE